MKLMGNVAGVTVPRPDWAQTDPGRADFIRNKPDVEAVRALAAEGKQLAQQRLLRSGDTMTGELGMSGNRVTGLGEPVDSGDAATRAYVDGKRLTFTGALMAGLWSDSAPYVQSLVISDIIDTDMPHVTPAYSSDVATAIVQKEDWVKVSHAETEAGLITFTCFEEKPTVDITVQIEVMR